MEYKAYYFDNNGEPQMAKNNFHAEHLKKQGVKMYTKEEAKLVYTSKQEELKRISKKLEDRTLKSVKKTPKE